MSEALTALKEWFFGLGSEYGVNPIIFGSIYVGAIPFFTLSLSWIVRNYKKKKSILVPSLSTVFFFISSYLYLIIAGENVPWWVYAVIILLVVAGAHSTIIKLRKRIKETEGED